MSALALVLTVVGVKMLTASWLKEVLGPSFNLYLLGVVLGILALGVVASFVANRWKRHQPPAADEPQPASTETGWR